MASTPKGTLTLDPGTQGAFGARPPESGAAWVTQTQQRWGAETQPQEAAPFLGSPAPALRSAQEGGGSPGGSPVESQPGDGMCPWNPALQMWARVPRASPAPRHREGPAPSAGGGPAVGALAEQQLINLAALGVLQALGEPGGRHAARMGRKSQRAPGLIVHLDCWRESSL